VAALVGNIAFLNLYINNLSEVRSVPPVQKKTWYALERALKQNTSIVNTKLHLRKVLLIYVLTVGD